MSNKNQCVLCVFVRDFISHKNLGGTAYIFDRIEIDLSNINNFRSVKRLIRLSTAPS